MKTEYSNSVLKPKMERTDSSTAIASLAMYDDRSDDEEAEHKASVDNISDDEGELSRPPSQPVQDLEDENSKSSVATPAETKQKPKLEKKCNSNVFVVIFRHLSIATQEDTRSSILFCFRLDTIT